MFIRDTPWGVVFLCKFLPTPSWLWLRLLIIINLLDAPDLKLF